MGNGTIRAGRLSIGINYQVVPVKRGRSAARHSGGLVAKGANRGWAALKAPASEGGRYGGRGTRKRTSGGPDSHAKLRLWK